MAASFYPMRNTSKPLPITEPAVVEDVFVLELVRVERLGPCLRLSFAVEQEVPGTTPPQIELAIKAKIVIPVSSLGKVSAKLLDGEEIELSPDVLGVRQTRVS